MGALKQAHVGLALLSGFGGANTAKEGEKNTVQETAEEKWKRGIEEMRKAREKAALMAAERKKNADEMKKWQMDRYNQLVEEYTRQGDKWATFKALKQSVAEGSAEVATLLLEAVSVRKHADTLPPGACWQGLRGALT